MSSTSTNYKAIPFAPFTGLLDHRTPVDQVPPYSFRKRLNFMCNDVGSVERRDGFERLLAGNNNQDLSDQLLDFVSGGVREPITLLFEATSSWGTRYLLAGTRTRIYQINETTGNWRILGDSFGMGVPSSTPLRWQAAQSLDTVVFTNNSDKLQYYDLDAEIVNGRAIQPIGEADELTLTKAACICSYKDCIVLGNVMMGGKRYENMILWGDRFRATSLKPQSGSVAGYQMLDSGEKLIRLIEYNDGIMAFTNRGFWFGKATGADPAMAFTRIGNKRPAGDKCLAYPNCVVDAGGTLVWLAREGIHSMDNYLVEPERPEWVYVASKNLLRDIDANNCDGHVMVYWPQRKEVQLFYASTGYPLPQQGLAINPFRQFVSELDYGITAACSYRSDSRVSFRDWLVARCLCLSSELSFVNEGSSDQEECDSPPSTFFSDTATPDYLGTGLTTEDWDQEEPSTDSFLATIGDINSDSLCEQCNEAQLFVVASSADFALKQCGGVMVREMAEGNRTWSQNGYVSWAIGILGNYGTNSRKSINRVALEADAESEENPLVAQLKMGFAYSALDPIPSGCDVLWSNPVSRPLVCRNSRSAAEYAARKTVPDKGIEWGWFIEGQWLYFDLRIGAPDQTNSRGPVLPGIGGACSISGATIHVRVT